MKPAPKTRDKRTQRKEKKRTNEPSQVPFEPSTHSPTHPPKQAKAKPSFLSSCGLFPSFFSPSLWFLSLEVNTLLHTRFFTHMRFVFFFFFPFPLIFL